MFQQLTMFPFNRVKKHLWNELFSVTMHHWNDVFKIFTSEQIKSKGS